VQLSGKKIAHIKDFNNAYQLHKLILADRMRNTLDSNLSLVALLCAIG
jgi:hypothetical protein